MDASNLGPRLSERSPLPGSSSERRTAPTFEVKFLVHRELASELLQSLREELPADPHCQPELGDAYQITSLYLDTPELRLFHRTGSGLSRKFRIRRYGQETTLYLEQKTKQQALVRKRRVAVGPENLEQLRAPPADWNGGWFAERLHRRDLHPQCQLAYVRTARMLQTENGPIRFTIDQQLHAQRTNLFALSEGTQGPELLGDQRIVELKFRETMPAIFRELVSKFGLLPASISKYRLAMARLLAADSDAAKGNL